MGRPKNKNGTVRALQVTVYPTKACRAVLGTDGARGLTLALERFARVMQAVTVSMKPNVWATLVKGAQNLKHVPSVDDPREQVAVMLDTAGVKGPSDLSVLEAWAILMAVEYHLENPRVKGAWWRADVRTERIAK